jgi:hypothetical protein
MQKLIKACIRNMFRSLNIILILNMGLLCFVSCDKGNTDNKTDPNTPNKLFECSVNAVSNCNDLYGSWYVASSGVFPYREMVTFGTDGKITFKDVDPGNAKEIYFKQNSDCSSLDLRSLNNEKLGTIEIVNLSQRQFTFKNTSLCGDKPCILIRSDMVNNFCAYQGCANCDGEYGQISCKIQTKFIDRPGETYYNSSVQQSNENIVILTPRDIICINKDLNIQWEYKLSTNNTSLDHNTEYSTNLTIDSKDNSYILYLNDNPRSVQLLKISKEGTKIFDKSVGTYEVGTSYAQYILKFANNSIYILKNKTITKVSINGDVEKSIELNINGYSECIFENDHIKLLNAPFNNQFVTVDYGLNNVTNKQVIINPELTNQSIANQSLYLVDPLNGDVILTGTFYRTYGGDTESKYFGFSKIGLVVKNYEAQQFILGNEGSINTLRNAVLTKGKYLHITTSNVTLIEKTNIGYQPTFTLYYWQKRYNFGHIIDNHLYLFYEDKQFTETIKADIIDLDDPPQKAKCI